MKNSIISTVFKTISYDSSCKPKSEKDAKNFIFECKNYSQVYLGKTDDSRDYSFIGLIYCHLVTDKKGEIIGYYFGQTSSSGTGRDLFTRPEMWKNFKIKYAGEKAEKARKKIETGEYKSETIYVRFLFGDSKEDIQCGLNIFETTYISSVPEDKRLNSSKGGGNYIKTEIKVYNIQKDSYNEECNDPEQVLYVVEKRDLIRNIDSGNINFKRIQYKDLSEEEKESIKNTDEVENHFVLNEELKEEVAKISDELSVRDYDRRKKPCIKVSLNEKGKIDLDNTIGFKSITDCHNEVGSGCYGTTRRRVNSGTNGFYLSNDFAGIYLHKKFNL